MANNRISFERVKQLVRDGKIDPSLLPADLAPALLDTPAKRAKRPEPPPTPAKLELLRFFVPVVVVSTPNRRDFGAWTRADGKRQKLAVWQAADALGLDFKLIPLPMRVTMTRLGGNKMDTDNLDIAFKAVRDAIAHLVGVDDGYDGYDWKTRQKPRGERRGILITIEPR